MQSEMATMAPGMKAQYVQQKAQAYVMSSAPCNNVAQKAAYGQYKM